MAAVLGNSPIILFSICFHSARGRTQQVTSKTPSVLAEVSFFSPFLLLDHPSQMLEKKFDRKVACVVKLKELIL